MEAVKEKIVAKFYKRLNKVLGDYSINLCSTTDIASLPSFIKTDKSGKVYVIITGTNLPMLESVEVEYIGKWVKHQKYGYQFKADCYSIIAPNTLKGIVNFLSGKSFRGIGKVQAQRIVDAFGNNTINVIENNPIKLITVKGMSEEKIETITSSYNRLRGYSRLAVFLSAYGISSETATKIYDKYDEKAESMIRDNPYVLMDIRGVGFYNCDKIAIGIKTALDSKERVEAAIITALKADSETNGNMFTEAENLKKLAMRLLNDGFATELVTEARYHQVFEKMKNEGKLFVKGDKLVFSKNNELYEKEAAKRILALMKLSVAVKEKQVDRTIFDYLMSTSVRLSKKQQEAVEMALMNKVTVITGGAGTGKTTIVKAVINCYRKIYPDHKITLMAPTGKAARRMEEATGKAASTIHSRLEIYDGTTIKGGKTIPKGLVVVDEVSMLDSFLLAKILHAITDLGTSLLLVGDDNQLPSIGAGAVLTQLIKSQTVPYYKLTEIFRQSQGNVIVENAEKVIKGDSNLTYNNEFRLVEVASELEAQQKIIEQYRKAVSKYGIKNVALLCPLRKKNARYSCVSDVLNEAIQNAINPKNAVSLYCVIAGKEYRLHDRVMQFKNTDTVSNGDTGEITAIEQKDNEPAVTILWDSGNSQVAGKEELEDIGLAYAMSIHKSQGMEYDAVILALLSCQKTQMLKNKAILYTGITRAKKEVVIVGNKSAVTDMINSPNVAINRNTLLALRLKANSGARGN